MRIEIEIKHGPEDEAIIGAVATFVAWQINMIREVFIPAVNSLAQHAVAIRDAIRPSDDGEYETCDETHSYPYGGTIESCDGCGYLTCRCSEIGDELDEMIPGQRD